MSEKLNNPEVLKHLCDNIAHLIGTLCVTGVIQRELSHLYIDVADADGHRFIVQPRNDSSEISVEGADTHVFDEYTIGVLGGGEQSKIIATFVAKTILSSLNMVDEHPHDSILQK